jgi:hypothetical protein
MAGELSERVVRRAARTAARQTALISKMNQSFGDPLGGAERDRQFARLMNEYDALPGNLQDRRWSPFVNEVDDIVSDIIADITRGQ